MIDNQDSTKVDIKNLKLSSEFSNLKILSDNSKTIIINPNLPAWISLTNEGYDICRLIIEDKQPISEVSNMTNISVKEIYEMMKEINETLFTSKETLCEEFCEAATVFLTTSCNFSCKHCFYSCSSQNTNLNSLDFEQQFIPFLDDFVDKGGKYITLTGGEPSLVNLEKYLYECYKRGIQCAVLTNGSMLTDELCKCLKESKTIVQVSLDGDDYTFSNVRNGGSYSKVLEGIKKLCHFGIVYDISFMPCKVNISSFKSIVNIAIQNNANSIHMPLLEDYGSASINYPLLHLDDEELIVFFDELIDEYYNGLRERIKITYIDAIEKDIMNSNKKTSCLLGRQYGALYSNGVLYPCSETIIDKFQIGSFKNGTYTKNNSTMIFDGLHVDNYNKCKDCYLKYYCGGGCRLHSYIHTGSLYNEDSNCKIIKHCYEKIWLNIS